MASTSGMSLSSCCASAAPAGSVRAASVGRPYLVLSRLSAFDGTGDGMLSMRRPLPSHHKWNPLGIARRGRTATHIRAHLGHVPDSENVEAAVSLLSQVPNTLQHALTRMESVLYTLADATVAADGAIQKDDGGWLGGLTNALESVLKVRHFACPLCRRSCFEILTIKIVLVGNCHTTALATLSQRYVLWRA